MVAYEVRLSFMEANLLLGFHACAQACSLGCLTYYPKITAILSIFCSVGKVQGIHAGTFASCYITRMVPIAVAVSLQKVLRELVRILVIVLIRSISLVLRRGLEHIKMHRNPGADLQDAGRISTSITIVRRGPNSR